MRNSVAELPVARTWRDIPQQVKPRAMSREGRRRRGWRVARLCGGVLALAAMGAAGWQMSAALTSGKAPASARLPPIGGHVTLVSNGVLDRAWLMRRLALPPGATLGSIDPAGLRARVLAGGQVAAADVIRHFPNTLEVHLSERMPVVRMMAQIGAGAPALCLVDREGVVYVGAGYDPQMVATLPWLDGVHPSPGGPGIARVSGMASAADFLARSRFDAGHLFRSWRVISLARLDSDGLIQVRTDSGTAIVFGTRSEDLYPQLARLDSILDTLARGRASAPVSEINLSLGPNVPVAFAPPAPSPSSP